jgi:hypothetical protein
MKRFLSAVCLCVFLLISGVFFLLPSSKAQNNFLQDLLDLPSPPPPNPLVENAVKDKRFYSKNNPPKDDAPIQDLMDYWQAQNQFNPKVTYTIAPSSKALERLMSEIEKNPEELINFLNVISQNEDAADFVKRLYDREMSDRNLDASWRESVKQWLTYNSNYYSEELAEFAAEAAETTEYVTNQAEVLALARVDWDKARPLLDRMLNNPNQPILQTLARWAYYEHSLREGNTSDVDRFRKELQETVEDKNAKPGNRDLAMDAIVEAGDFPGRDDWYFSLLEDETLFDLRVNGSAYTSLTTLLNHSPPEKYLEKMLELIKSDNQTIRNVAARNLGTLLDERHPEVIRALLPWLENPKWAKEVSSERTALVSALAEVEMPESVPGLIAILNESETREAIPQYSNTNSNAMVYTNTNPNPSLANTTSVSDTKYPFRTAAINALATQKDVRAASALRAVLAQVEVYQRPSVVNALQMSHGFSVPEQIEALEIVLKNTRELDSNTMSNSVTYSGNTNILPLTNIVVRNDTEYAVNKGYTNSVYIPRSYNPNDIKSILGNQIMGNTEPSNELVAGMIDRISVLEKTDATLAMTLRRVMMNWRGAAINSLFLRDLKIGKANTDSILRLLSVRKELKEKQSSEVLEARGGASQTAFGITSCLLEDANEYNAILAGDNTEAKIAMLGCTRLIRAALPVQKVAENLKSPNKLLARAAELYLESEDSPEARQIVLSMHAGEAKILGARTYFSPDDTGGIGSESLIDVFVSVNESLAFGNYYFLGGFFDELEEVEKNLQKEVKENQELLGAYAYDGNFIRIYKDKAVYSRMENAARYRERDLTKDEFDNFKNYLASERVDELAPFLLSCNECKQKELLMLGRGGGRRVYVKADRMPPFFAQLDDMFAEMRKPPAKLKYNLEKDVAGLEILLADDILQARAVWKSGNDFRVLLDDTARRKRIDKELDSQDEADEINEDIDYEKLEETRRKRREQREYENFSWFKIEAGKLGDFVTQPAQVEYLPVRDSYPAQATIGQWKSRAAGIEIRADESGLYKLSRGAFTRIRAGYYDKPVVSANGRWAVVTKYDEEGGVMPMRVNLLTNREFKIVMPEYALVEAVVFIPATNKFVIFAGSYYEGEYEDESVRPGDYFLLDAETGVVQPAKGEISPLVQQTFRPLQSAVAPDEFWAAIPDSRNNETDVGIYNAKTLSFKAVLTIPQIKFNSMSMWIDAGKVYFVYEGHLLSLPLPKV